MHLFGILNENIEKSF